VITGFVTIDGIQRPVTITRRQTRKGENVELNLAGRSLTWNADEGARAVSSSPSVTERLVIERLTYDSPDYFVLAQLRGASYFTVAQNVRPENAPDEYDGPVWTVIRVDESATRRSSAPSKLMAALLPQLANRPHRSDREPVRR
jgi:hypothetical protein